MGRKHKQSSHDGEANEKRLKKNDPVIVSYESYNVKKLLWILEHKTNDIDAATLKRYQDILPEMAISEESWPYGVRKVEYYHGTLGFGRLVPAQFSYILMSKKVRQTIADDQYIDIDIVNCHPHIYWHLIQDLGNDQHREVFKRYLEEREECISECLELNPGASKDDAKAWFLMVMNGGDGNPLLESSMYMVFYKEAVEALNILLVQKLEADPKYSQARPYLLARDGWNCANLNAKIISCALMDYEDKMRGLLCNFLISKGCDASVQCYDGVMSFAKNNKIDIGKELALAAQYIEIESKVACQLKIKSMTDLQYDIDVPSFDLITFDHFLYSRTDCGKDYGSLKNKFERNNFFCLKTVTYYHEELDSVTPYTKTDFISKYEHLQFLGRDKKGNPCDVQFIHEWIKDPNKRAYPLVGLFPPGYSSHSIDLSDPTSPRYAYSVWKGLRVQHIIADKGNHEEDINVFRDHTLYLCGGNHEFRDYLERCLKHIFCYPGAKTDVAIAFKAVQGGEGKNTWWEFVAEMIGRQYCYHSSNHERDWFGDFNEGLRNKIWVHMEEISKNVLTKHQKQFLAYVTSKEDVINLKGGKKITWPSYCNYFLTFNSQGIDMFPGLNRRLWIHEMEKHAIKPRQYYDQVYKTMKNPQALRAIYDWIMEHVNIDQFNPGDESQRPFTPYMNKLWGRANSPKDKLEQWVYDKLLDLWSDHIAPNSYRVRLMELYEMFKNGVAEKTFLPNIQNFSQRVQELLESACVASISKGVKYFKLDLDACLQVFVDKHWISWEDMGFKEEYDTLTYVCVRPCKKACTSTYSKMWKDESRAVQHFTRQREPFLQYTCDCNGCYEISSK